MERLLLRSKLLFGLLIGPMIGFAQLPTSAEFDVQSNPAGDSLRIYVTTTGGIPFDGLISEVKFTLRWPSSLPATIGPRTQFCQGGIDIQFYQNTTQNAGNGWKYATFTGFALDWISNVCPDQAWIPGQPRLLMRVSITNNGGTCTPFNIANDAYTTSNGRESYVELNGQEIPNNIQPNAGIIGNPAACAVDCLQIPNGTAFPGTPCDDNNPNTFNDTYNANCECIGMFFPNDCLGIPSGPNMPGTPCDDSNANTGADTWNSLCVCVGIPFDCNNVLGGPDQPGTPCDDNDPATTNDTWTVDCDCEGTIPAPTYTVLIAGTITPCSPAIAGGIVSITSIQGTEPNINVTTTLSPNCEFGEYFTMTSPTGWFSFSASCMNGTIATATAQYEINVLGGGDTLFVNLDCSGAGPVDCNNIPNGPDMPGTPCDDGDPNTINDTWTANCICTGINNPGPCDAGFWVIQAYENDPLGQPIPIPYNLWVWNLSTGASPFQFLWNFGDGTSSTEAFPTHVYPGTGPYYLCLGIWDATGCTDTYCDTVAIDGDGIYQGMMPGGGDDRSVLTISVVQNTSTSIEENTDPGSTLWPNPATDLVNISLDRPVDGRTRVSITDLEGRLLRTMDRTFTSGTSTLTLPVADLAAGVYILSIENGGRSMMHRFVRGQ